MEYKLLIFHFFKRLVSEMSVLNISFNYIGQIMFLLCLGCFVIELASSSIFC